MLIRKLMVLLGSEAENQSVLDASLAVARPFHAHIEAVFVHPGPAELLHLLHNGYYPGFAEDMQAACDKLAHAAAMAAQERFETWRKQNGLPADGMAEPGGGVTAGWREESGSADILVTRLGRLSDLVVMLRPSGTFSAMKRYVLENALFATGHPVLLVPPCPIKHAIEAVAIAWNGSAEAARAVSASLQLLQQASRVVIFVVKGAGEDASQVEGLKQYLARHEITATGEIFEQGDASIGDALLARATRLRIDLLVMGAYTHSRTREQIFGGTTLHVLKDAEIPVLLAH